MSGILSQNIISGRSANLQSKIQLILLAVSFVIFYNEPFESILKFILYFIATGFLVSGYLHRYCTHRSWNCPRWLEAFFMLLTTAAMSGLCITWVALHKDHHRYTDKEGDPHGHFAGIWNNLTIFSYHPTKNSASKWMLRDKMYRFQMKYYWYLVAVLGGTWSYFLGLDSWILFTTTVYVWQVGINLIGHSTLYDSINRNHVLAGLWGGELYHNDHHKNPMNSRLGKIDFPYFFMIRWFNLYK